MLTKEEFRQKLENGLHFLDGATGSNLQKAGMPRGCCTEEWVLAHPEALVKLQRDFAEAGSQILLAPTFQAQPIALERVGLHKMTEDINARLVALSRSAAPGCLIAGDLTTFAMCLDSWDEANFDIMVDSYRRQIRGLIDGGADLLLAETLMYPLEAEAILTAAEMEGATCCGYTFTMQPDGALFSGREAAPILRELELAGAAAVGFNCVSASDMLPGLVQKLRRSCKGPIICKPNAGNPRIDENGIAVYDMQPDTFGEILAACRQSGADLMGGCCGTEPAHIRAMRDAVK